MTPKKTLLVRQTLVVLLSLLVLIEAVALLGGMRFIANLGNLASVLPGVLTALTNDARTREHLASLTENETLSKGAQMKAEDMARNGYFSHVGPDGKEPWAWFREAGYQYEYAGENLAVNFNESEDVVNAWLNSPSHRANIMKAQFSEIGIGVAKGTYKGRDTTFVVQFFGRPGVVSVPERSVVGVAPEQIVISGDVLGTSTALVSEIARAPLSDAKVTLYTLVGLLFVTIVATLVFRSRLPTLWSSILILFVLSVLLGYTYIHKEEILGVALLETTGNL